MAEAKNDTTESKKSTKKSEYPKTYEKDGQKRTASTASSAVALEFDGWKPKK